MRAINWRAGFLRAWVLVSIIWAIGWGLVVLPDAEGKITLARMTDAELMSKISACKLPPGVPEPPKGFYLTDCLKALDQQGRTVERWGGGDSPIEQAFRIASSFAPSVAALILPPLGLLLFGATVGWVLVGFTKEGAA